ncbi:endonuclease-reverse transcriptase domain-containing protein [Phthorimaea operculella]|nr:endonuclease-reverse transcriptase domain-containing protein [Phthorimaea operculella]
MAVLDHLDLICDNTIDATVVNCLDNWWKPAWNSKQIFSLIHVNIRSLQKHFSELLVVLHNYLNKLDVIVITEPNISFPLLDLFKLKGFNTHSISRSGRRGGGVLVYTREGLNSQIQEAASTAVMQVSECVSITLNHLSEPIHIISVYRPPRINKKDKCKQFFEEFKKLLDSLPQNSKVIFCGDLNINLLLQNNKDVITYENLLAEYGFTKCINKITRSEILADTLVESCLDHIYVRAPLAGINSAVIQHKISDHYLISVAVDWKQSQTVGIKSAGTPTHPSPEITASSQRRRVLDNRAVRDKLLSVNFDELMSITCPLELYEAFRMIFKNIYDSCYVTRSY